MGQLRPTKSIQMSGFSDYLKNRHQHLQKLIEWGLEAETKDRFEFISHSKKNRILNSLRDTNHYHLFEKIKLCYSTKTNRYFVGSKSCQNIYCPNCRTHQAMLHRTNARARIKEAQIKMAFKDNHDVFMSKSKNILVDAKEPTNNDHHHITGFIGLVAPNVDDVKSALKKDSNTWNKIRNNINKITNKPLWIEAAYEFELINWRYLELSNKSIYKIKQIEQMRKANGFDQNLAVLVHYHAVTNLTKEELTQTFKDYYFFDGKPLIKNNQANGLYVQKLHDANPLFTNIDKLTSYPFKQALRFKHSFIGSDYSSGEPFTPEELSFVIKLYDEIKGPKLFKSATNGLKPWNDLETFINTSITHTKQTKRLINDPFVKKCLPHLATISNSIFKTRNAPERLGRCVKAMKAMASLYVDEPKNLSSSTDQWFCKTYEGLYYIIRNLSKSYVRTTTVERTIEQLKKQRAQNV